MNCYEQLPTVHDLEIISVRPNGPVISFKAEIPINDDIDFFIHPKCVSMHAKDVSFSIFAMENELIPLTKGKVEYTSKITTLKSNKHYTLKLDLYTMNDQLEEYELVSDFETPYHLTFLTQDRYYWISCAQCRYCNGLSTYHKIDDAIFRFIASFCAEFNFYSMSTGVIITDNGLTIKANSCNENVSALFGDFLYAKDERKFRIVFHLEKIIKNSIIFGFATNEIGNFVWMKELSNRFVSGNSVTILVDMKTQIGSGYMHMSNDDEKYSSLSINLPEHVAIAVSFRSNFNNQQQITVKECGFVI